jgi:hypothetical protein
MSNLTVWAPGTRVKVKDGDIVGRITAVHVYNETLNVDYTIVHWNGGDRKSTTVDACEVEADPDYEAFSFTIGFHTLKPANSPDTNLRTREYGHVCSICHKTHSSGHDCADHPPYR